MSYRNIFFTLRTTSRDVNHKWRKFQKSKLPGLVITKRKTKMIEVPVDDDGNETADID